MRKSITMLTLAILLAGCGNSDEASPTPSESPLADASLPEPDLASCKAGEPNEGRQRNKPLEVPEAFGKLAKSDIDHFAITASDGNTICVDTGWMEGIYDAKASPDGRFFAFGWEGYEAGGYMLVDRSGKGQVVDTGVAPLAPASGHRFAAVEISESGFGSLNAFAVWDILPVGLKEIANVSEGLSTLGEWRVEGWEGDTCVKLGFVPSERIPENYEDLPNVAGNPWFASEKNKWVPKAGSCPKA